jgi:undecaprenyl-diphosphatase
MTFLHAIILGIVEGATELLPISSTAHMIMVSHILHIPQTEFLTTFQIVIQLGAILAVAVYFWRRFFISWEIYRKLFIAFIPVMIIGFFLHDVVKHTLGDIWMPIIGLIVGGVGIIIFERYIAANISSSESLPNNKQSLLIGLSQVVALFPGISRSAATIIGGRAVGLSRSTAAEFSFLLALPVMFAGTVLDITKLPHLPSNQEMGLLLTGGLVAGVVTWFSIRWLMQFIQKQSFEVFGWYRIIVSIVFLFFFVL